MAHVLFEQTTAITGLRTPTDLDVTASGQVFVAERSGIVKSYSSLSDATPTVAADLRTQVHNFSARGLMSLAVDPNFPARPYIYVYYNLDAKIGGTPPLYGTAGATNDNCAAAYGGLDENCIDGARVSRLRIDGESTPMSRSGRFCSKCLRVQLSSPRTSNARSAPRMPMAALLTVSRWIVAPASAISGPPRPSMTRSGSSWRSAATSWAACRSPLTSATVMNTRRAMRPDKSNALRHADELWQRVFRELKQEYDDVASEHLDIDALCYELVRDPGRFQVIVSCNLFGDIVSDLVAALGGGLGLAPSASLHPGGNVPGLFEPVHGSAPELAGRGLANPLAMLRTVGLLLEELGFEGQRAAIERASAEALEARECTPDAGGSLSTREAGEAVLSRLRENLGAPGAVW